MEQPYAAEVVVWFDDELVDVTHVVRGASYRIGSAPDADLALDVAPFALVEATDSAFIIRRDARDPVPLTRSRPVALSIGRVAITITLVTLERTPVPRRSIERRPYGFGACSLVLHVGVWLLATLVSRPAETAVPGTETEQRRPTRVARFATQVQTVKRQPKPEPATLPITTDDTPSESPATEAPSEPAPPTNANVVDSARAATQREGARIPITQDNPAESHRFDPTTQPEFDTVKTGSFSTVATGSSAGERYELAGANGKRRPLIVVTCDAASCLVTGGENADGVRKQLQRRVPEIVACYEQYPSTAGRKVEMDFGIDDAGNVDSLAIGGVGDVDTCVTKIVSSIQFSSER